MENILEKATWKTEKQMEDNTKADIREMCCEDVRWITRFHNHTQWRVDITGVESYNLTSRKLVSRSL